MKSDNFTFAISNADLFFNDCIRVNFNNIIPCQLERNEKPKKNNARSRSIKTLNS